MEQKFDAIIVGAGPSGCACGYTLATTGLETLVVERGKFAGAKNMWGGAFYGPVLNQLFPNLWEEAPVERFIQRHRISLLTQDSCLTTDFSSKKFGEPPYNGFSLLRSRFDRWLASKVEEAGGIVATGLQADDLLWDKDVVKGIRAGGDEIPADVVIACDGVNSELAEKAGLLKPLSPRDMKQGVKEVIQLPRQLIEQRFNLAGDEGTAWEFIGSFTQNIPGGAYIYTNKDSLSVGIVVQLDALVENKVKADDILEEFKRHPEVGPYLSGGKLVEYSAHLIPVGGKAMMPALYTHGFLVAGDAAAMTVVTGLTLEGANFAVASGVAAAETVIQAKQKQDFSKSSLSYYPERLNQSFVLQDLNSFRNAPHFLENPRIYSIYPALICEMAEKIFTNAGRPRERIWELFKESKDNKVSLIQIISDMIQMKRAL